LKIKKEKGFCPKGYGEKGLIDIVEVFDGKLIK
jgi:hypothetical protein